VAEPNETPLLQFWFHKEKGIVRVNWLEPPGEVLSLRNPFRCFNSSPEVIHLTVMMYVRYPLSLRQVEDILFERGIDICHETIRFLVESLRSDVRQRDQEGTPSSSVVFALALAPGRCLRQDQWRDALPLASGRSRRRGATAFQGASRQFIPHLGRGIRHRMTPVARYSHRD